MTVGLSATGLANKWLDVLRGTAFTPPAGLWVKLHNGDPGAAGTANPCALTTRAAVTLAAAQAGESALTGTAPVWLLAGLPGDGSDTIRFISVWDSSSPAGGNFLWSAQLSTAKTVANGDTLTLTTCGLKLAPVAT